MPGVRAAAPPLAKASAVAFAALGLFGCGEQPKRPLLEVYDFEAHLAKTASPHSFAVVCERECPQKRYLFKGRPELTAADVATARAAVDPATGAPVVLVRLDQAGRGRFLELTRRVARRGRACRCPQHVAVLVKRRIESLPYIDFEVYPDGVPAENGVQINLPSLREARELARDLNAP